MADFITREKEFRKLNEKLDDDFKRSTTLSKPDRIKDARQNPLTSICYDTYRVKHMANNNANHQSDRFATYTKEKNSNLNSMRKAGGGDCDVTTKIKSPISPKNTKTKTNYGSTFHYRAKSLPKGAGTGVGNGINYAHGAGLIAKGTLERRPQKFCAEEQNTTKAPAAQTPTTTSSHKSAPKDIMIVYKNDKFTTSSSMDDILKRNITEPFDQEDDGKESRASIANNYKDTISQRAESTQPLESLGVSGAKASQKMVNTSSLIRFLKSKVALLEESQARNQDEMTQQKEVYEATLERHKLVTTQLDKALSRNSALTEQLEKANSQLSESNRKYREQSQECLALKKELESVKRELKHLTLNYANLEKRYARTKEETEQVQKSCTSMRQGERDLKESFRRETESKNAEIKYLKKQRTDLFTAYKKQLFLIDNLKQQNVCMEQAKMIDFCEKEFSKILEWNLKA